MFVKRTKITAVFLVVAFFAQGLSWACPDHFVYDRPSNNKLAPAPFSERVLIEKMVVDALIPVIEQNRSIQIKNLVLGGVEAILWKSQEFLDQNNVSVSRYDREIRINVDGKIILRYLDHRPDHKDDIPGFTGTSQEQVGVLVRQILIIVENRPAPRPKQLKFDFTATPIKEAVIKKEKAAKTIIINIAKLDSKITASVMSYMKILEGRMHRSYVIMGAIDVLRDDITAYGHVKADAFERFSKKASRVLAGWAISEKSKEAIRGRLANISAKINERDALLKSAPPAGSVPGVFKHLCSPDIQSLETPPIAGEVAINLDRSYDTIRRDLWALYYHLHLLGKWDVKESGPNARYYVPEHVKNRYDDIYPILKQFIGKKLRPTKDDLKSAYAAIIKRIGVLDPATGKYSLVPVSKHTDYKGRFDGKVSFYKYKRKQFNIGVECASLYIELAPLAGGWEKGFTVSHRGSMVAIYNAEKDIIKLTYIVREPKEDRQFKLGGELYRLDENYTHDNATKRIRIHAFDGSDLANSGLASGFKIYHLDKLIAYYDKKRDIMIGMSIAGQLRPQKTAKMKDLSDPLEVKAAAAFTKFAMRCREEMWLIRQYTEKGDIENIKPSVERVLSYARENFRSHELNEFNDLILDSMNHLYAISFSIFVKTKAFDKDVVFKMLDDTEAALRELEKLMTEGRLLDAAKARITSGYLDASLILDNGNAGQEDFLSSTHNDDAAMSPSRDDLAARLSRLQAIKEKKADEITEEDKQYLLGVARYFDLHPQYLAEEKNGEVIRRDAISLFILTSAELSSIDLSDVPASTVSTIDDINNANFTHELGHLFDDMRVLNLIDYKSLSLRHPNIKNELDKVMNSLLVKYYDENVGWQNILSKWDGMKTLNPKIILALVDGLAGHMEEIVSVRAYIVGYVKKHRGRIGAAIIDDYLAEAKRSEGECRINLAHLKAIKRNIMQSKENAPIDINESIQGVAQLYTENNKFDLQLQLVLGLPHVYGDDDMVSYIWINLFRNSIDAIREAKKADETRRGQIIVKTQAIVKEDKGFIEIGVSDNGIGIPEELLLSGRLFQERATTKKYGSGLGLYLIKQTVEELGGTIDVQSEPGKGTTFTITLPVVSSSPAAADSFKPSASPISGLDSIFAKDIELKHVSEGKKPVLLKYEGSKRPNSWDYEIYWLGSRVGDIMLYTLPSWHSDKQMLHLQHIKIWPESWQRHGLSTAIVDWLYLTAKNNNLDFTITGDDGYLERAWDRAKAKYGENVSGIASDNSGSSPLAAEKSGKQKFPLRPESRSLGIFPGDYSIGIDGGLTLDAIGEMAAAVSRNKFKNLDRFGEFGDVSKRDTRAQVSGVSQSDTSPYLYPAMLEEQSEITDVAEWYGQMYKHVVDSNYDRSSIQYTFLSEARDPAKWVTHSELGTSLNIDENDYCNRLSRMTIAELLNEYNSLEPRAYVHQVHGKTLPQLERTLFCGHLLGAYWTDIFEYDDVIRKNAIEILEQIPTLKTDALYSKKKLLLLREWAYRHWDGKPKVASHLLFNLEQSTQKTTSPAIAISVETERIHATNFRETIQARPEIQPLIIAVGTSWMKGYKEGETQHSALNPLIISMRNYCESKGISFIDDEDGNLLDRINAERAKDGNLYAKVVVLAGKDTVMSKAFAPLRDPKENAFVVGVDNEKLEDNSYIRLVEMLNLALKLSSGIDIDRSSTAIGIKEIEKSHFYIFIPPAKPMSYEDLRTFYEVQRFA